jgi:hypothetical protein
MVGPKQVGYLERFSRGSGFGGGTYWKLYPKADALKDMWGKFYDKVEQARKDVEQVLGKPVTVNKGD